MITLEQRQSRFQVHKVKVPARDHYLQGNVKQPLQRIQHVIADQLVHWFAPNGPFNGLQVRDIL